MKKRLFLIGALTCAGLTLLLWVVGGQSMAAPDSAPTAELRVCLAGCLYSSIQDAVDAANDGDVIKVAEGVYTDVHGRPSPPGYYGPAVITQVVYISKSVTIRGGYSLTDWTNSYPDTQPTTLDAMGQGRVLFIAGAPAPGAGISPVVENLRLIGGDAAGLLGHPWAGGSDTGGGVHVVTATVRMSNNQVLSNTASWGFGGGLYLEHSAAALSGNTVSDNVACYGGGVNLMNSDAATLNENHISGNHADSSCAGGESGWGGGLYLYNSDAALSDNTLYDNTATQGGGLWLNGGDATLNSNDVISNAADYGGGLWLGSGAPTLTANTISANHVVTSGGGLFLDVSDATLNANTISGNIAGEGGGGVYLRGGEHPDPSTATLQDNTIIYNDGENGGGVVLEFCANTTIRGNIVASNTALFQGGGMVLFISSPAIDGNRINSNSASWGGGVFLQGNDATFTNNVIADNWASGHGSALYSLGATDRLYHTTIARNRGGDGSGIYATDWMCCGGPSNLSLVNTIMFSHSVGINVMDGGTVMMNGVLWHDTPVTATHSATATVIAQNQFTGDPLFVDPDAGDYHIGSGSAALSFGSQSGLTHDIDGQPRPMGWGYDLGADEYPAAYLDVVQRASAFVVDPGQTLTYDVFVTSTGMADATNVTLMGSLDAWQQASAVSASMGTCAISEAGWGGAVSCVLGDVLSDTTVTVTLTAQVSPTVPPAQPMSYTVSLTADGTANSAQARTVSRAPLVFPLSQSSLNLDVNRGDDAASQVVLAQLMETLYRHREDGRIEPAGALSYTVSPDGLMYTVTLRPDALWSDGQPVLAQHYVDGILRLLDPDTDAGNAWRMYYLVGAEMYHQGDITDPSAVGVTAAGDYSLVFTLEAPAAFFPSIMAGPAAYPVRLDLINGDPDWTEAGHFVGNGPYTLWKWDHGLWLALDKNPLYHG
ncbi:MAG: ABC transporter substrate-binding protein, partial [Anaerolineae bacterium]